MSEHRPAGWRQRRYRTVRLPAWVERKEGERIGASVTRRRRRRRKKKYIFSFFFFFFLTSHTRYETTYKKILLFFLFYKTLIPHTLIYILFLSLFLLLFPKNKYIVIYFLPSTSNSNISIYLNQCN